MPSFCAYFNSGQCRSCTDIVQDYATQIAGKEAQARAALSFLAPFTMEKSVESPRQGFRNRAKMVVTGTIENPIIGLPGEENLDLGRELLACPIHHPKLNALISALPQYIRAYNLIPYRIQERQGELKSLIAFYSAESDEFYLRFVLRSKECVSRIRKLLPELKTEFPALAVVTANIQPIPHAILEGPEEIYLTERQAVDHRIGAHHFHLTPQAFVQTNSEVAEKLYAHAAEWIRGAGAEKVMELFCGQGAFSFFAAATAKEILGVDINPSGVKAAAESAREQGLSHLQFRAADAADVGAEITAFKPDLILVNPPRRGLGRSLDLLLAHSPQKIIYSSCSLESLAADLQKLSIKYRAERVQLFDLFPHTAHFETLVLLSLR